MRLDQKRKENPMYVTILHEIHDPAAFGARAESAFPPPAGLHVHQFVPADDMSRAVCLYEADSLDHVREFVDGVLGDSSTQKYFAVAETQAMGLPSKELA
jgi:hypothetical protein